MSVKEYFEALATEHQLVRHSDTEPHFACSMDDAATRMARRLYYPAIFLEGGDFYVTGTPGGELLPETYVMAVVQHVKDSGNEEEKTEAFKLTKTIARDILGRMVRDKKRVIEPMQRFNAIGTEAHRVELADAGLYGWIIQFDITEKMSSLNCNENLDS